MLSCCLSSAVHARSQFYNFTFLSISFLMSSGFEGGYLFCASYYFEIEEKTDAVPGFTL